MSEIIVLKGIHRTTIRKSIYDFKPRRLAFWEVNEFSAPDLEELFKTPIENQLSIIKITILR